MVRLDQQLEGRGDVLGAERCGGPGLGAGAVQHQNVDGAEVRHGLFDGGLDAFRRGEVRLDGDRTRAISGMQLGSDLLGTVAAAAGDRHANALCGQGAGHGQAQTAG
ncbi:hypothetical protein D9M72_524240 [compost metagenome]